MTAHRICAPPNSSPSPTQRLTFIEEVRVEGFPGQPLQWLAHEVLPLRRPALPSEPAEWPVAARGWQGQSQALHWDAGGAVDAAASLEPPAALLGLSPSSGAGAVRAAADALVACASTCGEKLYSATALRGAVVTHASSGSVRRGIDTHQPAAGCPVDPTASGSSGLAAA